MISIDENYAEAIVPPQFLKICMQINKNVQENSFSFFTRNKAKFRFFPKESEVPNIFCIKF